MADEIHVDAEPSKWREVVITPDVRRQPEPPDGLAKFEQHVMASDAPAVVLVDRALIRALLRYVRRLERDVAEGSFW